MSRKKTKKYGNIIKGIIIVCIFILVVLIAKYATPSLFQANLAASGNVCEFTKSGGYINQGFETWTQKIENLPDQEGPEDTFGILGYQIKCNSKKCNSKTCKTRYFTEGETTITSVVKEKQIPYSTHSIELLGIMVNNTAKVETHVAINGNYSDVDGKNRGIYESSKILYEGAQVLPESGSETANFILFLRNKEQLVQNEYICGIAVFKYNTDHSSILTGTVYNSYNQPVANANVVLEPCPRNSRGIRTIWSDQECTVPTNNQGQYIFPNVLPSKNGYTLKAEKISNSIAQCTSDSDCSVSCQGNKKTISTCLNGVCTFGPVTCNLGCGASCANDSDCGVGICNLDTCFCTNTCNENKWGDWTECSKECNGIQTRINECLQTETRACNTHCGTTP